MKDQISITLYEIRTLVKKFSLNEPDVGFRSVCHKRHVAEGLIYWGKDGKNSTPRFKNFCPTSDHPEESQLQFGFMTR